MHFNPESYLSKDDAETEVKANFAAERDLKLAKTAFWHALAKGVELLSKAITTIVQETVDERRRGG